MLKRSSCTRSGGEQLLRRCNRKWRDWASLPSEITEQIASRLLEYDVTEYLRFRAACKAWRMCTEEPRSLESPFRPRRWIMLSNCDGVRRRFLNLNTGACAHLDLPELSGHRLEGSTEGLLVLRDKGGSNAIRLLHPFTRSVVELPPVTAALASVSSDWIEKWGVGHSVIQKACISDETSPPSVALFLFGRLWNIAYAKPGDEHWSLVDEESWSRYPTDRHLLSKEDARRLRCVGYNSSLTLRGRIYFSTFQGNILMLQLHPRPLLVPVIRNQSVFERRGNVASYLVHGDDDGESLLMVRFHHTIRHIRDPNEQRLMKRRKSSGFFKLRNAARPGRRYNWYQLEVYEVDLEEQDSWYPVHNQGIGQRSVFIGDVDCVSLSSRVFPSVYGDAVYFGTNSFCSSPVVGVRRLKDGTRAEPRVELGLENGGIAPMFERIVPRARPCSLEEYLVGYVSYKDGIKD